jgi:hypothetical protein
MGYNKLKIQDVGVASIDLMSILNFVKISQIVEHSARTDVYSVVLS